MHLLPLCALNHHKTAISKTTKSKLKTQKNRLNRRFFCKIWSECGDSNPGPPAPKAGALPTAQHPDMKLWDCPGVSSQSKRATNCATPGYEVFQLWSNMGSAPVFDQFPARGRTPSALASQSFPGFWGNAARTPASRSQSRRATSCATPGYEVVGWPEHILPKVAWTGHQEAGPAEQRN